MIDDTPLVCTHCGKRLQYSNACSCTFEKEYVPRLERLSLEERDKPWYWRNWEYGTMIETKED